MRCWGCSCGYSVSMAYPEHYLMQFGGTLGTPAGEIWSCGIRLVLDGNPLADLDESDFMTEQCVPALAGWFGRATSKISSATRLAFVKFNLIDGEGLYVKEETTEYFWPVPLTGAGGTSALPFQCSVALTWETDEKSRGLASKGRIYSPGPTVVTSNGLFSSTDALGMAQSAATLIAALEIEVDASTATTRPAIVSRGRKTGEDTWGTGEWSKITSVSVDNRVDIQRRRGNQLVPVRSTQVIAF